MALISCEVTEGPRPGFKAVEVPSVEGFSEYFSVEDRVLVQRQMGEYLLPVHIVGRDPKQGMLLVTLPVEADSGANRVWVWNSCVQDKSELADEAVGTLFFVDAMPSDLMLSQLAPAPAPVLV